MTALAAFKINDWYWIIGGDAANVHSSRRSMLVPVDDATYQEWLAADAQRAPMPMATMRDLESYMADNFPPGTLKSYNGAARFTKASGGVIVTSLSPVQFITDPVSRNSLANANEYIKATPGTTVNWKMSDGSFVVLDEAQLLAAVTAVATFVESCFTCESQNVAAIDAGTITTLAQIDDAFAAVSNVFP